jgi:hypothetical protein
MKKKNTTDRQTGEMGSTHIVLAYEVELTDWAAALMIAASVFNSAERRWPRTQKACHGGRRMAIGFLPSLINWYKLASSLLYW